MISRRGHEGLRSEICWGFRILKDFGGWSGTMISNFVIVSLSLYRSDPDPVDSLAKSLEFGV